jgi:putative transposase
VECPTPTATGEVTSWRADSRPTAPASRSLGVIVGNFKSVTTRRINRIRKSPGVPLWQRSFYDHIIRNERELRAIREYIIQNPLRWDLDRDNPDVIQINQGR